MPSIAVYNLALSYAKRIILKRRPDISKKELLIAAKNRLNKPLLALAEVNLNHGPKYLVRDPKGRFVKVEVIHDAT